MRSPVSRSMATKLVPGAVRDQHPAAAGYRWPATGETPRSGPRPSQPAPTALQSRASGGPWGPLDRLTRSPVHRIDRQERGADRHRHLASRTSIRSPRSPRSSPASSATARGLAQRRPACPRHGPETIARSPEARSMATSAAPARPRDLVSTTRALGHSRASSARSSGSVERNAIAGEGIGQDIARFPVPSPVSGPRCRYRPPRAHRARHR